MIRRYTNLGAHSSSLGFAAYNEKTKALRIRFKRALYRFKMEGQGPVEYEYRQIPPELYCALLNAKSIGKFFNKHIRSVYVGHAVKK